MPECVRVAAVAGGGVGGSSVDVQRADAAHPPPLGVPPALARSSCGTVVGFWNWKGATDGGEHVADRKSVV